MIYRWLLRLLPRHRRARYGDEMAAVFADQRAAVGRERGWLGVIGLWVKEAGGLTRFSLREWIARLTTVGRGGSGRRRPNLAAELRWAWRGLRSRGWRAVFSIALMAIAVASTTLVFSVADALVFHRVPYPDAHRVITVGRLTPQGGPTAGMMLTTAQFAELENQTDLLSGIGGYLMGNTFLLGGPEGMPVDTVYVTPGLVEILGVVPRWGRSLTSADAASLDPFVALIAEDLARDRFGDPARAVGQVLQTSDRQMLVVGVMPSGFRFPSGRYRLWRALDLLSIQHSGFAGVWHIARLAVGPSVADVERTLTTRLPALATVRGEFRPIVVMPYDGGRTPARPETVLVLFGASICLLLTGCANVASLELTGGVLRSRLYAIQLALGASRASLTRIALLEGGGLAVAAGMLAAALTAFGVTVLNARLPTTFTLTSVNPIDLDWRAAAFLLGMSVVAWLLASFPLVYYSARSSLLHVLKSEGHGTAASRASAWTRRLVTIAEVAIAVMLLVGGWLYIRTYASLVAVPKGLDSDGVLSIDVTLPAQTPGPVVTRLSAEIFERLKAHPGVLAATTVIDSAPPGNAFTMTARLEVGDEPASSHELTVTSYRAGPGFFDLLKIPLRQGRPFRPDDADSNVILSETMARRLFPNGDSVGRTVRLDPHYPWYTVVGVVGHVQTERDERGGPSASAFTFYQPPTPPRPAAGTPASERPAVVANVPRGPLFRFLTYLARLDSPARASEVLGALRNVDSSVRIRAKWLDDVYAERHAKTLVATSTVAAFSAVAFLVAVGGVYGVMAFFVAGRTREIGVRIALGARGRDIGRLVLGSSLRLALTGTAIGLAAAIGASRWIAAELFGVTPTDPLTYAGVAVVVVATALGASWQPARRAARVDPAVTLRSD